MFEWIKEYIALNWSGRHEVNAPLKSKLTDMNLIGLGDHVVNSSAALIASALVTLPAKQPPYSQDPTLKFIEAAGRGDVATVNEMMANYVPLFAGDKFPIDAVVQCGNYWPKSVKTALIEAIEKKQWSIVFLLINEGADVNFQSVPNPHRKTDLGFRIDNFTTHHNWTPLMMLAFNQDTKNAGPLFLYALTQKKGDLDRFDEHGLTIVNRAIRGNNHELFMLCMKHGFNVNLNGNFGGTNVYTPLYEAVRLNRIDLALTLLESGAEVDLTNRYENTPIALAAMNPNHVPMLTVLIEAGAELDNWRVRAKTPIHYAVYSGCPYNVACLLLAGANLNQLDDTNKSALDIYTEAVEWNQKNPDTPRKRKNDIFPSPLLTQVILEFLAGNHQLLTQLRDEKINEYNKTIAACDDEINNASEQGYNDAMSSSSEGDDDPHSLRLS